MLDGVTALTRPVETVGPMEGSGERPAQSSARDAATERFVRLYEELFPPVYGYVRFRVRDAHAAEDVTAQVFERALTRLASLRDAARARAWVFTIARNAVADYRRAQRPALDLDSADALERLWVDSPEGAALQRDEARQLLTRLAELSDRERELIGLRFAAGLTNREIGDVCGLSEANVAQIVHRAVVKLRRQLDVEENRS